jgi:hypothetical protein
MIVRLFFDRLAKLGMAINQNIPDPARIGRNNGVGISPEKFRRPQRGDRRQ